jgi:hypothetical protein
MVVAAVVLPLFLFCFCFFVLLFSPSFLYFLYPWFPCSYFCFYLFSPSFPLYSPVSFPPLSISLFLYVFFVLLSLKSPQCSLNLFFVVHLFLFMFLFFSLSICSLLSIISPSFFVPFSPGPPLVFIRGRGREPPYPAP